MSNHTPASSNDDSATVGIGGRTSGQQGATPSHETQTETGGNGGPGLTRNQSGPYINAPDGTEDGRAAATPASTADETPDSAATQPAPGAQDTRPDQAGPKVTGMGTLETGGNQDAADLPPPKR